MLHFYRKFSSSVTPFLNNTVIVEVTMLDDSNIDAEHLAMTKMMTDVHTQTHHHYLAI